VYESALAKRLPELRIPVMKNFPILLAILMLLSKAGYADELQEPELNHCNSADSITKCTIKCVRSLGDQCMITHVNFEGTGVRPGADFLKAKFKTCKNANLDLQIKSLRVELEKLDTRTGEARIAARVSASEEEVTLGNHARIIFSETLIDGRIGRTYFDKLINSGENHVTAQIGLQQCGHVDGTNTCSISGSLVAVTDPNIRCDFHDKTKPGAYVPVNTPDKSPIGRVIQ